MNENNMILNPCILKIKMILDTILVAWKLIAIKRFYLYNTRKDAYKALNETSIHPRLRIKEGREVEGEGDEERYKTGFLYSSMQNPNRLCH